MKSILKRSFLCYPIFPFFVSAILGTSVAGMFPNLRDFADNFLWGAVWIILLNVGFSCFSYFGFSAKIVRNTRRVFWAVAFGFICLFLFFLRTQQFPEKILSPTEVSFTGDILELSRNSNATSYGLLKVLASTEKSLNGKYLWFTFAEPKREVLHNTLDFKTGDIVKVKAVVRSVLDNPPTSWGYVKDVNAEKSFNKYLHSRFVYFKCFAYFDSVEILHDRKTLYLGEKIAKFIKQSLSCETYFFDDSTLGALRAMILGDKSELSSEQKKNFKYTGAMHIFAVSGLHVGVVALGLYFLCSLLGIPLAWRVVVALPILFLYVLACGLPPSAVRAFLMVAVFWIAFVFSRGSEPMNALMLSAIVAILFSPTVMYSAGFQLSYAVVGALLTFSVPVAKAFEERFNRAFYTVRFFNFYKRVFKFFVFGFCMSIGSSCVAAPISAYWFGAFSISGIFVSPIFVCLASCAVILAMLALLPTGVGTVFATLAIFCVWLMQCFTNLIVEVMPMYISLKIDSGLFCCFLVIFIFSIFIFTQKFNVWLRFCLVNVIVFLTMYFIWIFQ